MPTRREVLIAVAAALAADAARAEPPAETIALWPGTPPGGGGPTGASHTTARGTVTSVGAPSLTVIRPARPTGAAVVVASGGGYRRLEDGREAAPAARWLAARGVTAFILDYRLPGEGWAAGPLAPLQDAQRAIRLVRARAAGFGLDPARLGVLGFSAGGHLMGLAATRSGLATYAPIDADDALSARPAAAALIYPVVTLAPPHDRTSTRRVLIGTNPTSAATAAWSVETAVGPDCPPLFLIQADDDPVSDPMNSEILAAAATRAGVAVERHRLATGGHGFGMGRPGSASAAWPVWYEAWLGRLGFLA